MCGRYDDIDPRDIDPETGRPYAGYDSPCLDNSFHEHEMDFEGVTIETIEPEVIKEYLVEWCAGNTDGFSAIEIQAVLKLVRDMEIYAAYRGEV